MPDPQQILLLALATALLAWLTLAIRRAWKAWLLSRRMSLASRGEHQAEHWLTQQGYTVLDRQLVRRATMRINDRIAEYDIRADLLVQIGSSQAIVEVKTGEAADPRTIATRRQLREYTEIFGIHEIYLFDATNHRLHKVEFAE